MLSAKPCLLFKIEVLGIQNILKDNPLPSYPTLQYYISKDQSARNSIIRIYHTNQLNTRLYSTVKHANRIDSWQDGFILAGDTVIDTSEVIDFQIFGLVVKSITTSNNINCVHLFLSNCKISYKQFPIYFISFLDYNNIISIYCLF